MTFGSILCPIDFSAHARHALRYAAGLARRFGGRLTVLFVNDPLLLAVASPTAAAEREFVGRTRDELARFIDRTLGTRQTDRERTGIAVSTGNPAARILHEAKRGRHDLVVVGTHGLSGVQRLFFGSTTEQVLHHATVPVLAVPPARRRRVRDPAAVTRVLVPIDLAGEWQSDAIHGAAVARAFDAELVLLHVLAPVQTPPWLAPGSARHSRPRSERAERALARAASRLPHAVRTSCTVAVGNPAHEIARLARDPSTLVVMSLRGTAGMWGRRGSIAYHVLTEATTPVLALPRRPIGGSLARRLARAVTGLLSARDRIEIAGIDALLAVASGRGRGRVRR